MILYSAGIRQNPPPVVGGGGGGGDLTHGVSFNITGSGFGTKTSHDTLRFDDATGANVTDIWSYRYPNAGSTPMAYRSAQRSVSMPHSNVTKYLCGAHSTNNPNEGTIVAVGADYTKTNGYYSRWEWYSALDPAWVFDTPASANNHKWYGVSVGSGSPYADGTNQWYLEFRGGVDFSTTSGDFVWHVNDDAGGTGIEFWGNDGYYNEQANPFSGWVKRTLLIRWNSASTGLLYGTANGSEMANETEYTDGYSGSNRSEAVEGYAGNYNSNNWRYLVDVYRDYGPNDAAVYLTNNATWASATIAEVQPWSSWAAGSITISKCNKGQLSTGTVHVHIRSIVNGHQYIGTRTMN